MLLTFKVPTLYLGRQICKTLQFSVTSALTGVSGSSGSTRSTRYVAAEDVLSGVSYPINAEIE